MVLFFLGVAVVSSAFVAWGIYSIRTVGETQANGLAIGIGGSIAIIRSACCSSRRTAGASPVR